MEGSLTVLFAESKAQTEEIDELLETYEQAVSVRFGLKLHRIIFFHLYFTVPGNGVCKYTQMNVISDVCCAWEDKMKLGAK
jgi:hypothetical protein